tara:strand:- start:938 stop:1501 length:564 start_codon:yes stop_codon:yes gene_type:complete
MTTKKTRRKSPSRIQVIDNFLPTNDFITIKDIFTSDEMAWYRVNGISADDATNAIVNPLDNHYFVHLIYLNYMQTSNHFETVKDALQRAMKEHIGQGFRNITRIKANLYSRTEEVQVHPFHSDSTDIVGLQGALLSLNTCDGYTGFEDGTEVDSVENRMVFFDSTKPHHSTSCSNAAYRLNINVNFL